jgi:HPt (histidine-containing phosphotransfer) domain-containing protein
MASDLPQDRIDPVEIRSVRDRLEELLGERDPCATALVERMVTRFPDKAAGLLEHLFAEGASADQAVHAVHALRGAASNLGSLELAALCELVEDQLPERGLEAVAEQGQALRDAVTRFAQVLSREGAATLGRPSSAGAVR